MKKSGKDIYRSRIVIIIKVGLIVFWGAFIFFIATNLIQNNTINTSVKKKIHTIRYLPEGWGFFTKSPREYVSYVYRYNEKFNRWQMIPIARFSLSSFFGLSRRSTQLLIEIEYLLRKTDRSQWKKLKNVSINKTLPDSVFQEGNILSIKRNAQTPTLNGKILLIRKKILPWEWRNLKGSFTMPVHYIKLNIISR